MLSVDTGRAILVVEAILKHKERLAGVHPELIRLIEKLDKIFPLIIVSGFRSLADQHILYKQGRDGDHNPIVTYADGGSSPHNYGLSVDIAPDPLNWNDLKRFDLMRSLGEVVAREIGVSVDWGGSWPGKKCDRPHVQISDWKNKKEWQCQPTKKN